AVEYARHRGVDRRREGGLHAAVERNHPARMPRPGPRDAPRFGQLRSQRSRKHGTREPTRRRGGPEQRTRQQALAQQPASGALAGGAGHALLYDFAPNFDEPSVAHARGTRGLAGATGETAVEVKLSLRADRLAFEHLLHQIDAAARSIELV